MTTSDSKSKSRTPRFRVWILLFPRDFIVLGTYVLSVAGTFIVATLVATLALLAFFGPTAEDEGLHSGVPMLAILLVMLISIIGGTRLAKRIVQKLDEATRSRPTRF